MLRLIGLLVVLLLLVGPLLDRAGMLGGGGLLAEFVSLEDRAFQDLLGLLHVGFGGAKP